MAPHVGSDSFLNLASRSLDGEEPCDGEEGTQEMLGMIRLKLKTCVIIRGLEATGASESQSRL